MADCPPAVLSFYCKVYIVRKLQSLSIGSVFKSSWESNTSTYSGSWLLPNRPWFARSSIILFLRKKLTKIYSSLVGYCWSSRTAPAFVLSLLLWNGNGCRQNWAVTIKWLHGRTPGWTKPKKRSYIKTSGDRDENHVYIYTSDAFMMNNWCDSLEPWPMCYSERGSRYGAHRHLWYPHRHRKHVKWITMNVIIQLDIH